jgi:hypothetical protein
MAKMTKAQARKRLGEAEAKVLNVMLAGHIPAASAVGKIVNKALRKLGYM